MDASKTTKQAAFVYFLFFLSGAAALIYEISWSRQIGLLFGHTVHAASIVLASYFAGMAIGYALGAKVSQRVTPLIGYGVAELLVAVWAMLIPTLIGISESEAIAPWLSSPSLAWQTGARALFSFLLLLPATIALGATLPMMAGYLSRDQHGNDTQYDPSSRIAFAYSLNTAGALAGVLLATYYLLAFVGVRSSSYFAASLSIVCAVGAVLIGMRSRWRGGQWRQESSSVEKEHGRSVHPRDPRGEISSGLSTQLYVLSVVSGFGTLALQVFYTRMFSLVFHNSTYTFAIVVAVFLASLAIGAAWVSRLPNRMEGRTLSGVTLCLGALAIVASILVFIGLTDLKYFSFGNSFVSYIFGATMVVFLVVAPAIVCLGTILPMVWRLADRQVHAGRVVGISSALNTVAAAVGAMLASFLILPIMGLWESMILIAVLYFVAGAWQLWTQRRYMVTALLGGLLIMLSVVSLNSPLESNAERARHGERLIQRWSSAYGWIDVVKRDDSGRYKIRQNLHYRFGTTGEHSREFRQAHIPLLIHRDPTEVLFLGLGTGMTAGGAIPVPEVEHIAVVELIPEVVEATRLLAEQNNRVVDHAKTRIYIDDARHHLLASERQYDVIISDLFVPWESQSGYLYTVEHYEVAARRLKENGLFCQWLPLYQVGEREFELIANSFSSVFPNTTLWWGQMDSTRPVVALIGSAAPLEFDATQVETRLKQINQGASSVDPSLASSDALWGRYLGDWHQQPDAPLNTDEHPRVEFLTPISQRSQKMIYGEVLEDFYLRVLARLPSSGVRNEEGEELPASKRRQAVQRLLLFGY